MVSVTQYGAIFAANGCKLNFVPSSASLEVVESPKDSVRIIDAALADIAKFEDTSNFADGMAAIHLADYIDKDPNPISSPTRIAVLNALGITKDGKFVSQVLAQQKTNRSWHSSTKPFECSHFGEICTHRGIENVPGKRGRKSTRSPEQYHRLTSSGEISREQLVTPAIENLVGNIPSDSLISMSGGSGYVGGINLDRLSMEEIEEVLARINAMKAAVGENVGA